MCAPGQARPGNALDAASSRRMSHRRYGKPVRLGSKGPGSLSASLCSQRRCLFSHSFFSVLPPFLPLPSPHSTVPSLSAQSALFYLPSLSLSFSLRILLLLYRGLARPTVVLGILKRRFVTLFDTKYLIK